MTTSPSHSGPMRLDAYRTSLRLVSDALQIASELPRGFGPLCDQLRRASTSVPLNIAEAYGKHSPRAKAAGYATARGEALEVGAILDVVATASLGSSAVLASARSRSTRVAQMTARLVARFKDASP